jgi:hypothetical protein
MKSGIKACPQEKINLVAANENPATFFLITTYHTEKTMYTGI